MRDTILREFERRQWSIKRLADSAGVPYYGAYRFVKGLGTVTLPTAEKLCKVLGLRLVRDKRKGAK